SADMRTVLRDAAAGSAPAALGLDVYIHRLRAGIASMAAALDGLDVLVFTGGVGEHAPAVRRRAADGLGFLGVLINDATNQRTHGDAEISAAGAAVRTLVLTAREDVEMARQARGVLTGGASGPRA
ncbi:MAG TPA: hypothetical protein VFN87_16510, partial [Solirubrobacteraceae bacterium]|nr:hypothetical protein [Solirubrobacteraceae bacterium]